MIAFMIGYILKNNSGWLSLVVLFANFPQYAMEIRFAIVGDLKITAGGDFDIGPIEVEMIFQSLFLCAYFFGVDNITMTLGKSYEFLNGTYV